MLQITFILQQCVHTLTCTSALSDAPEYPRPHLVFRVHAGIWTDNWLRDNAPLWPGILNFCTTKTAPPLALYGLCIVLVLTAKFTAGDNPIQLYCFVCAYLKQKRLLKMCFRTDGTGTPNKHIKWTKKSTCVTYFRIFNSIEMEYGKLRNYYFNLKNT